MRAGLERYVSRRALRQLTGLAQGKYFGVWLTGTLMKAFAHNFIAARNHATDHRIRLGGVGATFGEQ